MNSTAILTAFQNGTLDNATIVQYLASMGASTMDPAELRALLTSMTKSQIADFFKTLGVSTDANRGGPMICVVWSLTVISTLVVTARLLIKWRVGRRIFYDDACMIIALVCVGHEAQDAFLTHICPSFSVTSMLYSLLNLSCPALVDI